MRERSSDNDYHGGGHFGQGIGRSGKNSASGRVEDKKDYKETAINLTDGRNSMDFPNQFRLSSQGKERGRWWPTSK